MSTTKFPPNSIGRVLSFNEAEKTGRIGHVFKLQTPATKTAPEINGYSITDPAMPMFCWGSGDTLPYAINDFMTQCKGLGTLAFVEPQILNQVLEDAHAAHDAAAGL
jgi:hypothetical protein